MGGITFCVASAKGGSGKTNLTATFATVLAATGKKVLMIDCDESTNGLTLLYIDVVSNQANEGEGALGLFELKSEGDSYPSVVTISENLDLVPAVYRFGDLSTTPDRAFLRQLSAVIGKARSDYDFIFIDAQAGADALSQAAMNKNVSDYVIVVSEYDPLSAAGVERLKAIMGDNLSYERTFILLNKMLPEFVSSFSDFFSIANYLPPIPWTADVVRAYAKRELAVNLIDGNEFTLAIIRTMKALPSKDIRATLEGWTKKQASALREPIIQQYTDSEIMLEAIYKQLRERRSKAEFLENLPRFMGLAIAGVTLGALPILYRDNGWFSDGLPTLSGWAGLVFAVTLVFGSFLLARYKYRFAETFDPDLRRLERQREILEKRLRDLEVLREGDFDSMVRNRANTPNSGHWHLF